MGWGIMLEKCFENIVSKTRPEHLSIVDQIWSQNVDGLICNKKYFLGLKKNKKKTTILTSIYLYIKNETF